MKYSLLRHVFKSDYFNIFALLWDSENLFYHYWFCFLLFL